MNQSQSIKLTAEISASSKGLIDALNQANSAINNSSQNWHDKFSSLKDSTSLMSQSLKNLGELVGKMGDADPSQINSIKETLLNVQGAFSDAKNQVDTFVQGLVNLKNEAASLEMPVEDYQRFVEAIRLAGVDMDKGQDMIRSMQARLTDFANGVPEAQKLFENLGITLEKVSSQGVAQNFVMIANAINDTLPASEKATASMDLFRQSLDKSLDVANEYKHVLENKELSVATDKDIQSATGFGIAVEKISESIERLANGESNAKAGTAQFTEDIRDLWKELSQIKKVLTDLGVSYANYVSGLKGMVAGNKDATAALDKFSDLCQKAFEKVIMLKAETEDNGEEWQPIGDFSVEKIGIDELLNFLRDRKKDIQDELTAIHGIMNQRLNAGAPIDTTELEEGIEHVNQLYTAIINLQTINGDIGMFQEDVDNLRQLEELLRDTTGNFNKLLIEAHKLNEGLDFSKAVDSVTGLEDKFKELFSELDRNGTIELDADQLKELGDEIDRLANRQVKFFPDDKLNERIENLKQSYKEINSEIAKGIPIWQPIKNAVRYVYEGIAKGAKNARQSVSEFGVLKGSAHMVGAGIRNMWTWMTHFKVSATDAKHEVKEMGQFLGGSILQIAGLGSKMAVLYKAWQSITGMVKEYVGYLHEAEKMKLYGNAANASEDIARVRSSADAKMEQLQKKLVEFANLVDEEKKKDSTQETRAKRMNLEDELSKQFGFEFKKVRGRIKDMDGQIERELARLQKARIDEIDAQIESNQKVIRGAREQIQGMSRIKAVKTNLSELDSNAYKNMIEEATEAEKKASDENLRLMEERQKLATQDVALEYRRIRTAKEGDRQHKEWKEANEKQTKALEEATTKLKEWGFALNDTEHVKKLREIMKKYAEIVEGGVKEEEAKKVAVQAIAKLLKDEKEAESKKNKELLEAVEKAIDAYKTAWKSYQDANREVVNAQREEAQIKRDQNRDARKEKTAKRRESIQKQMGRFGFTPFEGFELKESSSKRRERRRNAQLDASIADKMAKAEQGQRAHFTHSERERLKAYDKLQKKDRALEAAQKSMEASEKHKQAAQELKEAAKAIKQAEFNRDEARRNLGKANRELREATSKRRTVTKRDSAEKEFENAKKNGLTARGVNVAKNEKQLNYAGQLMLLHRDLSDLKTRIYLVK